MNYSRKAFSLAEILLTITIIGIVASLTIPNLINNINDSIYRAGYKKAYSAVSQAVMKGRSDNESAFHSDCSYFEQQWGIDNFEELKKQFVVIKSCTGNASSCWNTNGEKLLLAGTLIPRGTHEHGFIDSSGMSWFLSDNPWSCPTMVIVDTNGFAKPNQYGKDRFPFHISSWNDMKATQVSLHGSDYNAPNPIYCPSGNCYYKSWITNTN